MAGQRGSQSGDSASRQNPRTVRGSKFKPFGKKSVNTGSVDMDDAKHDRKVRKLRKLKREIDSRLRTKSKEGKAGTQSGKALKNRSNEIQKLLKKL